MANTPKRRATPETDPMLYWLGQTMRRLRTDAGLIRAQVAGRVPCDQSTLAWLENGRTLTPNTEPLVQALAESVGLSAPDVWELALRAWRESQTLRASEIADVVEAEVPRPSETQPRSAPARRKPRRSTP